MLLTNTEKCISFERRAHTSAHLYGFKGTTDIKKTCVNNDSSMFILTWMKRKTLVDLWMSQQFSAKTDQNTQKIQANRSPFGNKSETHELNERNEIVWNKTRYTKIIFKHKFPSKVHLIYMRSDYDNPLFRHVHSFWCRWHGTVLLSLLFSFFIRIWCGIFLGFSERTANAQESGTVFPESMKTMRNSRMRVAAFGEQQTKWS